MAIYAEKTADRQGIHTIDIATYGIDTELVQTEDEQIRASLQGDGAHAAGVMLAMERKGDVLLIRADKSGRMFNLNLIDLVRRFRLIAVIEVPDVVFNMIRVHSRSGDIRARRLMAEEMVLESTSGDLDIGGCMAKRSLVVHAGSGDVLLRATAPLQDIPEADVVCYGLWADPQQASHHGVFLMNRERPTELDFMLQKPSTEMQAKLCLLYTSDAADE